MHKQDFPDPSVSHWLLFFGTNQARACGWLGGWQTWRWLLPSLAVFAGILGCDRGKAGDSFSPSATHRHQEYLFATALEYPLNHLSSVPLCLPQQLYKRHLDALESQHFAGYRAAREESLGHMTPDRYTDIRERKVFLSRVNLLF
jgi:hypothetical protein